MRRADRLFMIVQHLRGGRLVTAAQLAERLEVTRRTVYRDVAALVGSGVPIEGEAGVGYVMRAGYDLPPLMFTTEEVTALVAGARLVRTWGGTEMARAAEEALVKIEAILPEAARERAARVPVHAIDTGRIDAATRRLIDRVEAAAEARLRLQISYADEHGCETLRVIRPLGVWFWGQVWTTVAWCELREDFRMFRLDRMEVTADLDRFREERGKTLRDFLSDECQRGPDEAREGPK